MPKKYSRGSGNIHPVDAHIGRQLRAFRERRGVSQQGLAERIDLSFQQIQKYEKGANRVAPSTLWKISKVLDITPQDFFEGCDVQDVPEIAGAPAPHWWVQLYHTLSPDGHAAIKAMSIHFQQKTEDG